MRSFQLLAAALSGEIIAPVLPAGKLRRREGGSSEFLQGGQLGSQEEKESREPRSWKQHGKASAAFILSFPSLFLYPLLHSFFLSLHPSFSSTCPWYPLVMP